VIADLTCGSGKGNAMAALALVVAMIDMLNSSGKLSDDEVTDICRSSQALLSEAGAEADDVRKALSGIALARSISSGGR
jgi:hypothetical protein